MNLNLDLLKQSGKLEISESDGKKWVYDIIRKKPIVLLPEELVRQCIIWYLVDEKGVSKNLISVERGIKVNGLFRRCDLILYDRNILPYMIIEVKRPGQAITQKVFNQIAMYNIPLRVPYLMVSNGIDNYACHLNFEKKSFAFIDYIPAPEKF
ncbi:type I restriction enzyme HsdR N-terminal domain-containing protein [Portibacter marinus]|uniref:type I restriction enzyme HsdR N-terminal domain-containing protein n=1 Tax=Portibacter marinus TaxID=2898660 RepID=UPI001F247665|nr:type I restriction enzyme HsdR N-terminal domain-containing protein [Portibacter marinus]